MKKTILTLAVFSALNLFASGFNMNEFINADYGFKQERTLETTADYKELESALKMASKYGDASKLVALGSLYEKEWKLKDGVIKPNIQAAKENYLLASKSGISLATFRLGVIALQESKTDEALKLFKKASTQKSDESSSVAAVAYGSLVLDKYPLDTKKLLNAAEILKPVADKRNLPTASFVLAHVYNALRMNDAADKYLTKACMAKNAPKQIVDYCFSDNVEVYRNGKKLEKTTCSSSCNIK